MADNAIVVSTRRHNGRPKRRARATAEAYVLIARGADGRTRCESFRDRGAYRSRLATLGSTDGPVTLEEVIDLLTDAQPRDPR